MGQLEINITLLGIIVLVGTLFRKTWIPMPLLLVIIGMLISLLPFTPRVKLNPNLVLYIFLPLLVYTGSAYSSWKDVRKNFSPIMFLSVGHVLFITLLIAILIHALIPQLGWPLAFVLGSIISPPDDIAILAIAEKIKMPRRIITILTGESLLNDATALIIFRFSLAAAITNQFSAFEAISNFLLVVIGETLYGFILAFIMGEIRLKIEDPVLQMMFSILTPFIAYIPAEKLGGCGVLATVVTGFIIGNKYYDRFAPEVRLTAHSVWGTLAFALQSFLFLMVGLNLKFTLQGISAIPITTLLIYSSLVILVVILGRFIWVYAINYLPRLILPSIYKRASKPSWQRSFIVSWAGMRGGISLAAALAVPSLPLTVRGNNPKDLLIFLVFAVITATLLVQGLTLPWLLKKLGIKQYSDRETLNERLEELRAREKMTKAVLRWLYKYEKNKSNLALADKIKLLIQQYEMRQQQYNDAINHHYVQLDYNDEEIKHMAVISAQINTIEREELLKLWRENKITNAVRVKLMQQLDHRFKNILG